MVARVLYVTPRFPVPSETFVAEEVLGMHERGRLVGVVALACPTADQVGHLAPRSRSVGALTTYLTRFPVARALRAITLLSPTVISQAAHLQRRSSVRASSLARLVRALAVADFVRTSEASLIYAHWPRASEVAYLASIMTGVPFAISVHAHEVMHDSGHFPILLRAARFSAFCNRAAMTLLARNVPGHEQRMHLIYHGVDLERFTANPLPTFSGRLRILAAGRLTPTKGFDRLIRGVAATTQRGVDVHLQIAGVGSALADLQRLAAELNVADRVQFLGWVSHEQMPLLLRDVHLFALLAATNYHDGLPNAVLEAMASGRAVIVSALPAAHEVITDGVSGLILRDYNNPECFADTCSTLLEDPECMTQIGHAAAAAVHTDHNRAAQLDRLAALMDESSAC